MRNTKQKQIILSIVNNSIDHLTAFDVYTEARRKISNISLGTVYRNLNKLVATGEIMCLKMPNGIERFDKNVLHAHVECIVCGKIEDVSGNYVNKIPEIKDYEVNGYDLRFLGKCNTCLKEEIKNGIKR